MSNKQADEIDEIIDDLTVGHIGWAFDQLDGTSFIKSELDLIEKREKTAKQKILQLKIKWENEARIDELKSSAYYAQPYKDDELELCGIDMTAEEVNNRIVQLEKKLK